MTAADIAAALGAAHRSRDWWRCICPVHRSRRISVLLHYGEKTAIAVGLDRHQAVPAWHKDSP